MISGRVNDFACDIPQQEEIDKGKPKEIELPELTAKGKQPAWSEVHSRRGQDSPHLRVSAALEG